MLHQVQNQQNFNIINLLVKLNVVQQMRIAVALHRAAGNTQESAYLLLTHHLPFTQNQITGAQLFSEFLNLILQLKKLSFAESR